MVDANSDHTPVTLCLEDLRHLFDLATDSPLVCSGSFENIDVDLLRKIAVLINVNPESITPDEFIRDYPHTFQPQGVHFGYSQIREATLTDRRGLILAGFHYRLETDGERTERLERSDWRSKPCSRGNGYRLCGRPMDHEMHIGDPLDWRG